MILGSSILTRVTRLGALSALVGASLWLAQSTFVPFASERSISYVLCTPSIVWLLADILIVALVLASGCLAVERWLAPDAHDAQRFWSARLLTPLFLIATNLTSVGLLWSTVRGWWSPIAYVAASLHPAACVLALALVLVNLDVASRGRLREAWRGFLRRLDPRSQLLILDVVVAMSVAAIVVGTSPKIRFSAATLGDEPKYLRYAENWWQGRGMDMDGIQDASATPAAKEGPHFLRNFTFLGSTLRQDLSRLAADADFLGNWKHWGHHFNGATYVGNWFVTGKNGGLYQIHQPGISILILPAYAIDRWLFDRGRARLADDLFTVNMVMLMIFMLLAVTTFHLLHGIVPDHGVAAVVTIASLASMPLAAFAFPFYPETMAALLVCWVSQHILSADRATPRVSVAIGASLGWLVWLHVRFIPLAGVLLAWLVWTLKRDRRAALTLMSVCGLVTAAFCLYVYHVSGSILPSALYTATPDPGFRFSRLSEGLRGILFDRENGLLALAPVYLLALPGLGLMLRHQRRAALVVVTVFLSLMIPVAGHGYETSGTTPLRHMIAVLPLAAVPIATWLRHARARVVPLAVAATLILVSVHSAAAYNSQNDKAITLTIAAGLSGWDTSLLFPLLRRAGTPGFDALALAWWESVAVASIAGAFWTSGWRRHVSLGRFPPAGVAAACLTTLAVAGCVAIAAGGPRRELRLLKTPRQSLRECRRSCSEKPASIRIGVIPAG